MWSSENFSDAKWPTVLCIGDKRVCNLEGNFLGGPPDTAMELPASITWCRSMPESHIPIIEKICGGGPQMEFAITDDNKYGFILVVFILCLPNYSISQSTNRDSLKQYILDPLSSTGERVVFVAQGMLLTCHHVPTEGKVCDFFHIQTFQLKKQQQIYNKTQINVYVCSEEKYDAHLKGITIPEKPQLYITLEALAEVVDGTDRLVPRDGVGGLLKIAANDYETTILTTTSDLTAESFQSISGEDFKKFKVVSCALPLAYFANNKIKKFAKDLRALNPASCAGLAPFVILDPFLVCIYIDIHINNY